MSDTDPNTLGQRAPTELNAEGALHGAETAIGQGMHGDDSAAGELDRKIAESLDSAVPKESKDPFLGRVFLNKYRIEKKLGEGGMGAVYKAFQTDVRRDVAIKVLTESSAESELMLKRFHVEAMAVSRLSHPHTIRIFDFGRTDDGTLFIVMEYLDGVPLNKLLRQRRELPVYLALKVAKEIAESLREAHEKHIVHRDLKPENVFLVKVDDDPLYAKVLDFGVAKMKEAGEVEGTLTQAGMIFGTPRYMSPEQATAGNVDHRTDIYALGCMLYEMLTGRPPFEAETPIALLFKHVHEPPRAFEEARPDLVIPPEVEALVRRTLEKRIDDRPLTMRVLLDGLVDLGSRLPDAFAEVVYRDGAEAQALIEHYKSMPSAPATVLEEGLQRTERRSPSELLEVSQSAHSRAWVWIAALGVVLLGAGGFVAWRALTKPVPAGPLPAELLPLFADDSAVSLARPLPENRPIRLTVTSTPPEARVRLGDKVVGLTPLTWKTLQRPGEQVALTLEREAFKPYTATLKLDEDKVLDAGLEPVPVAQGPAVVRGTGDDAGKPAEPAKPVEYVPVKVNDIKKNPYATKPVPGTSVKSNPYQ